MCAERFAACENVPRTLSFATFRPLLPRPVQATAPPNARQLGLPAIAWLTLVVIACRVVQAHSFPLYDDAFITYRYAENFAAGAGLVYNVGAPWEPVLGTTTPLYALLLGLVVKLGASVENASLAFNLASDALIAALIARSLAARPFAAAMAVLAFAALPDCGRISTGGMEPPMFVAFALSAAYAAARNRLALAGWMASLACLTRPEGVLIVAAVTALHVRSRRDALQFFVPIALVGSISVAWLTSVYGSPIAQSVRAKAGRHGLGPDSGRSLATLVQAFAPQMLLQALAPLTLLGFVRAWRERSLVLSFVVFGACLPLAYLAAGAKTWGWYYYAPLTATCVGLGLGLDLARARTGQFGERLSRVAVAPLSVGAPALASAVALRCLAPDRVTPRVYEPLAALLGKLDLERNQHRLLASDIGAVGYFSRGCILDSEGLVWPPAREYADQAQAVAGERPEYVMVVVNQRRMSAWLAHPVSADYAPIARFSAAGATALDPGLERLPHSWAQDYLVYQRRDLPPLSKD